MREAYAVFLSSEPEVACLQSTLAVDNGHRSWLAGLFALEYAALFDGLLPALTRLGMPVPLGGTSNHFRRAALETVGGWDPYNVTEDADLGLRLARLGYRSGTLDLPTLEEAPATVGPWLRQRTRWFKGWMLPVNTSVKPTISALFCSLMVHRRSPSQRRRNSAERIASSLMRR